MFLILEANALYNLSLVVTTFSISELERASCRTIEFILQGRGVDSGDGKENEEEGR